MSRVPNVVPFSRGVICLIISSIVKLFKLFLLVVFLALQLPFLPLLPLLWLPVWVLEVNPLAISI